MKIHFSTMTPPPESLSFQITHDFHIKAFSYLTRTALTLLYDRKIRVKRRKYHNSHYRSTVVFVEKSSVNIQVFLLNVEYLLEKDRFLLIKQDEISL